MNARAGMSCDHLPMKHNVRSYYLEYLPTFVYNLFIFFKLLARKFQLSIANAHPEQPLASSKVWVDLSRTGSRISNIPSSLHCNQGRNSKKCRNSARLKLAHNIPKISAGVRKKRKGKGAPISMSAREKNDSGNFFTVKLIASNRVPRQKGLF